MVRIACYYRVSKDRKGNVSIDVQRETCTHWIATHADPAIRSAMVLPAYIDDGKSAYTDDMDKRPAFRRLIADAKARAFDILLVYKLDRFARKRRIYFHYLDTFQDEYKITVKSATESDDWLSVGLNGLLAEQYSRALSARMKDVRRWEVTQQGLHIGRVPVGYDRREGVLTPNDEADGVRQLGRWYATGTYSAVRLAECLNQAGYTCHGGPFKPEGIKEIIISPVYAGYVTLRGELFPGGHDPLWTPELWTRMQTVAAERSFSRPRPDQAHHALLTGIARCAHCGGNMTHHSRSGSPDRYYRCLVAARRQQSALGLTCTTHAAYAGDVEAITLAWLSGLALLPDLQSEVQRALGAVARPSGPSRATVEEKLRRLARAYGDGAYTESEYVTRRADLMAQFEQAAASHPPIDLTASAALLTQIPLLMEEATPEERRAIVRQLVSEVYLYKRQVRALRPTGNTAMFFEAIDPARWLNVVQFGARSAPNEKLLQSFGFSIFLS